jgi:hypothetical protein
LGLVFSNKYASEEVSKNALLLVICGIQNRASVKWDAELE